MSTALRTIVFDFDGTIADSLGMAIDCLTILATEKGFSAADQTEAIKVFRQTTLYDFIYGYLGIKFYQLPRYVMQVKKIIHEHADKINLFDGINTVLQQLAQQYELAIISSNSYETITNVLHKANVSCIKNIDCDSSVFGKHVVIKRFLKKQRLNANQILYIGDETRDVDACKKIGVPVMAVTWGFNSKELLQTAKPDYLADACADIVSLVELHSKGC